MTDNAINFQTPIKVEKTVLIEDLLLSVMAYQIEARVSGNSNHILRTKRYTKVLAEKLRDHPRFSSVLAKDKTIENLVKITPLLDIGNVSIPDRILLKPGRITPKEFDVIKTHPKLGRDIIMQSEQDIAHNMPLFTLLKEVVYSHHERWDGSGYPEGLCAEAIPCSARIAMVVDVYDALVSRRVYKPAMTHKQAADVILAGKGSQFDPDIVVAFNDIHGEFYRIANTYAESEKDFKKRIDYLELAIGEEP